MTAQSIIKKKLKIKKNSEIKKINLTEKKPKEFDKKDKENFLKSEVIFLNKRISRNRV